MAADVLFPTSQTSETSRAPTGVDMAEKAAAELEARRLARLAERREQRYSITGAPAADRLYTVQQTARLLCVTPSWIHAHRAELPAPLRLGSASNPRAPLRFRASDIEKYIAEQKAETIVHRVASPKVEAAATK